MLAQVDHPRPCCYFTDAHIMSLLQQMRLGPLWQSLDVELDRCWAAQSATEEVAASTEDSWDAGDAEYSSSGSISTSMPTMENFSGARGVDTLWPLAARTAAYSSSPGQQTWLQDLSQVLNRSDLPTWDAAWDEDLNLSSRIDLHAFCDKNELMCACIDLSYASMCCFQHGYVYSMATCSECISWKTC